MHSDLLQSTPSSPNPFPILHFTLNFSFSFSLQSSLLNFKLFYYTLNFSTTPNTFTLIQTSKPLQISNISPDFSNLFQTSSLHPKTFPHRSSHIHSNPNFLLLFQTSYLVSELLTFTPDLHTATHLPTSLIPRNTLYSVSLYLVLTVHPHFHAVPPSNCSTINIPLTYFRSSFLPSLLTSSSNSQLPRFNL